MNTVAQPPHRDGKQPAGEAYSSQRTLLAAPLPNPHVSTSHSCGTSALSAYDLGALPFSIPPEASAFEVENRFREAFALDPCLSAQLAMGIR